MKYLIFAFLVSIPYFSFVQTKSEVLDLVIDSKVFKGERSISVFLPDAYFEEDTPKDFTVAYLFDAQFEPYFTMVSSIMSYYEQVEEGVPMIVVGIHTVNRWGEFVPTSKEKSSDKVEGANQLTLFLRSEVMPMIDSLYRTKDFKVGIGHSLGGTYVINEVIKQSSIFDAVIAVSPNLTMYNEQILADAKVFFTEHPENRRFIYTSVGTEGSMEQDFQYSLAKLDSIVSMVELKNMYWKYDLLQKANHMTTFVQSFDKGYLELSLKLDMLDDKLLELATDSPSNLIKNINDYYTELALFTHEKNEVNAQLIMQHAITLRQYGNHKACLVLCQYALELLEKEDVPAKKVKEVTKTIKIQQEFSEFMVVINEAKELAKNKNYEESSARYIAAFDLGVKRGTHRVRMDAVPVLAQAGRLEEAFKQLDLLANYFKLGGNQRFLNDEECKPLHPDKRWGKLMAKLEKNAALYR